MQEDNCLEKIKKDIAEAIAKSPPDILPSRLSILLHNLYLKKGIVVVNEVISEMDLKKYDINL